MRYSVEMFLIGVDCATKANKTGLAFGRLDGKKLDICSAERGIGEKWESGVDGKVKQWIAEAKKENRNVLLALDAPLGWPHTLGEVLISHKAGCALPEPADQMFDRETDRWIHQHINKNSGNSPFSVGADKIARTAHEALSFLERFRIPLAWDHASLAPVSAIEVYPAATLKGRGVIPSAAEDIIEKLGEEVTLGDDIEKQMNANDDVRDAAVCVLAAADFVRGDAAPPENMKLAKKEGWIWVKKP